MSPSALMEQAEQPHQPTRPSKPPMKKRRVLKKKSVFDEELVLETLDKLNLSHVHAHKLWRYLIQTSTTELEKIPELPKVFLAELLRDYQITTSKLLKRSEASDSSTTKLLIELQDGLCVESVIMRYGHVNLDSFPEAERQKQQTNEDGTIKYNSTRRATLCVSSQVGCAMGCTFCATGTMGLMANLTSGEIIEQLYHANKIEKIRGIVFMGMGEPLDNYNQVIMSIKAMTDTARFSLASNRISISTVGVVPRILQLIKDAPDIGFALSLHAPTQDLRVQIVPTAKAWNINKIMEATDKLVDNQNKSKSNRNRKRRILIEYVLISNVNDTEEVAHQLGQLMKGRSVLLNLIPYNPTDVPHDYKAPTEAAKQAFVNIVRSYDVFTVLRQTMGQDIDGACGQLVISSTNQKTCDAPVQDLEDLVKRANSTKISGKGVKYGSGKRSIAVDTSSTGNTFSKWFILALIVCLLSILVYRNL